PRCLGAPRDWLMRRILMRFIVVGVLACVALAGSSSWAQPAPDFTRADYGVGLSPVGLAAADFNGDTSTDLAVVNNDSGDVSILLGSASGTFADSGAVLQVGTAPSAIAAADFNLDGRPDIVIADELDNVVRVFFNQGDSFSTPVTA